MRNFNSQLKSLVTSKAIESSGGKVMVVTAGGSAKVSLLDADGAALTNPLSLTRGGFDFNVADTVASVDLYIQTPTGHFLVVKGVKPSGDASIYYDNSVSHTTFVIPFDADDQAGDATETGTGFTLVGAVQPNVAIDVVDIDATETIDAGTDSGDSGDADGFIDGLSLATAGYIKATNANGAVTLGSKLYVQDSANAGDDYPEQDISQIGKEVTYTLSSGADTAAGFIVLPQQLPASSL